MHGTDINPSRSYVGPRPTLFVASVRPLHCRSLSDAFPHVGRTLANRWRRLYSFCFSADRVFQNCRIITSNPPSFPPKINNSWGSAGWKGFSSQHVTQMAAQHTTFTILITCTRYLYKKVQIRKK
jgi:hypothetical protein